MHDRIDMFTLYPRDGQVGHMSDAIGADTIEIPAGKLLFQLTDQLGRELHQAAQREAVRLGSSTVRKCHVITALTQVLNTFQADVDSDSGARRVA